MVLQGLDLVDVTVEVSITTAHLDAGVCKEWELSLVATKREDVDLAEVKTVVDLVVLHVLYQPQSELDVAAFSFKELEDLAVSFGKCTHTEHL